jgi:CRP-like cAMP-binding protein
VDNSRSSKLRSAYLFRNLAPEELEPFLKVARYRSYSPNEMVIAEEETGEDLFLILSGSVRVIKGRSQEYEQVIGMLREGEFFGEMALIDRMPRSASVYAHEPLKLVIFGHDDLRRIFGENPAVGLKVVTAFAEVLSKRLRDTNDKLKTLLFLERTF